MQTEKQRILQLVSEGKIAVEEAVTLLEALEKQHTASPKTETKVTQEKQATTEQQEKTDEQKTTHTENDQTREFFEEEMKNFRKDLSQVGSVFMELFNTTVKKVKDYDFNTPFSFGEKVTFQEVRTFDADDISQVFIEMPNGSVTIEPAELQDARLVCSVRTSLQDDEETTRAKFLEQFVAQADMGTLRVINEMKWAVVDTTLYLPQKKYDEIKLRLTNGTANLRELNARKVKVKTLNGAVKAHRLTFDEAKVQTANGEVELRSVRGEELEAETVNGRVYIEGALVEVEAKSVNGTVSITNYGKKARKVEAETVAGAVELYLPSHLALSGKLGTNLGKLDVNLADVNKVESQDQMFSKTLNFTKESENSKLYIEGSSKTGTIIVRYTTMLDTEE